MLMAISLLTELMMRCVGSEVKVEFEDAVGRGLGVLHAKEEDRSGDRGGIRSLYLLQLINLLLTLLYLLVKSTGKVRRY